MLLISTPSNDPKAHFEKLILSNATAISMGAADDDLYRPQDRTARLLAKAAHLLVHYRELDP